MAKLRIALVYGGKSVEHEVSVIHALQAYENFDMSKYDVTCVYQSKNQKFYTGEKLTNIDNYKDLEKLINDSEEAYFKKDKNINKIIYGKPMRRKEIIFDLVFILMHGQFGEDGIIHGFFESLNIPYYGSPVLSAAVGQDKIMMKQVLQSEGIESYPYIWFYSNEWYNDNKNILAHIEKELGFNVIVKPASLGSSIGISIAKSKDEIKQAITNALNYDHKIIVEKLMLNFKEYNCSVMGDCFEQEASLVEEVFKSDDILSFQDKYEKNTKGQKEAGMVNAPRQIPAKISSDLKTDIEQTACNVFRILGNNGIVRLDFMYCLDESKLYVNEINTIPGALSYYLWEHKYSYSELLNELIELTIKKQIIKSSTTYSFDSNIFNIKSKGK